jgi:hypothetical protein
VPPGDGGGLVSAEDRATDDSAESEDDDHLANVSDGAGCTEVWEYLAERREESGDGS